MRAAVLVAIVSVAAALATRLPVGSEHLYSWDSVNFALGMEKIDLDRHQPHPPGYFGYVLAGRALAFGGPANAALLRVNLAATVLTLITIWWFTLRVTGSRAAAAIAWTLVLTSPLHWFYSAVAEIYVVEALVTLAVAAAAYACTPAAAPPPGRPGSDLNFRKTRPSGVWVLGAAIAVAGLCKLPAAVLMAPVVGYAVLRAEPQRRAAMLAAIAAGVAAALLAIDAVSGLDSVWRLSGSQLESVSGTAAGGFRLRALNRTARDVTYAAIAAAGAGGLLALTLRTRSRRSVPAALLVAWIVPYLAMCLLVHFAKPGYVLPLLAPLALWIGAGFASAARRRVLIAVVLIAAANIAQFALATRWSAEETGEGRRYAEKTVAQRARTELNSILRTSLAAIRDNDAAVGWFINSSRRACGNTSMAVLISSGAAVSWRHAMYYLPDATVIQVPDQRAGWLIAAGRRLHDATSGDIRVRAGCTVMAGDEFGKGNAQVLRSTREPFTMHADRHGRLLDVRPLP